MSQFSAKEPSLGYHYQIRYALHLLLEAKDKELPFIELENLDDVEVASANSLELHQTKFHNKKAANLTDTSTDIWKTIRVWSETARGNQIDMSNVLLILITTSEVSPNSIINELTENNRTEKSVQDIVNKLDSITQTSINKELKEAFNSYNKLSNVEKQKLVASIYVKDNALDFEELKKRIKNTLQLFFLPKQLDCAFNDLQGWWYEQCILHLKGDKVNISLRELQSYMYYLSDKYKEDNLPIDDSIRSHEVAEDDFSERCFVRQLLDINIGKNAINQSKRDYYRANEQRSKWIREQLLNPQEEFDYDYKLKDDWQGKFSMLQDDIENDDDDIVKEKCKQFYKSYYAESHPQLFIRPRVTEVFLVKGSCHMLADKQDIAWHPNYKKK